MLDTFLRALPLTYTGVPAAHGTVVTVGVDDNRLSWFLQRTPAGWTLIPEPSRAPAAGMTMPADTLWRLATGGITATTAEEHTRTHGDHELARSALGIVSVIR